jgi:tRNA/tmRNA/rRNA uracil-C5-methylase (TrmA/RlmC/RlmD family)
MTQKTIKITALGSDGDGVGMVDGKPVYVPFTLPGDEVRVFYSTLTRMLIKLSRKKR